MRIRPLVMALLLISLFVPAAGAIYIPGQEIPNDGLFHIMSAGDDPGDTSAPVPMPAGIFLPSLVSSAKPSYGYSPGPAIMPTAPDMMYSWGKPVISQGYKSILPEVGSIPPYVPGESEGRIAMPAIDLPEPDSEGNIIIGDVIGHSVAPPVPGYWDNLDAMDLHTNMPVLEVPALFGI